MAEYIEREALYEKLHEAGGCDAPKDSWADGYDKGITEAIKILNEAPAADVVEVVHGEWVDNGERDIRGVPKPFAISCSVCGSSAGTYWMRYCPNCGAKMDGERKEGSE